MTSCLTSNFLELPSFNVSETSSGFDDDDDDLLLSGIHSPQNPDSPDEKMMMMQKPSRRALPMGLLVAGGSVDSPTCFPMCPCMTMMSKVAKV